MYRLIELSLERRALVLLLTLILVVYGWMSFHRLPIDAFPDVASPQVKIILKASGMTPEEVENRVAFPIETEMLGIPKQEMLRTTVKYGLVDITLTFADGTDIYWARQQVAERLAQARDALPSNIEGGMAPITTPLGEMFQFTVDNPNLSLQERKRLLDWVIRPALRTVPGVADVNVLGGVTRTYQVVPDASKLAAAGISLTDLQTVLDNNNRNDGAGRVREGSEVLLVRTQGNIQTLDDLKNLVVAQANERPVLLSQVAEINYGELVRNGAVTDSGKAEVVEGLVLSLAGANARQVVAGVEQKIQELTPTLPKGTQLSVFYNRASLIDKAIETVSKALAEAILLVLILLMAFLGNWRAAVTVALVLPLSALITFVLMHWFGLSANLMSLGGLAIAIGMLVDAAVVVVENLEKHLQTDPHKGPVKRLPLIFKAVQEVALPVSAGVLVIIMVFLPLLSLDGLEGKLFTPVALTIVFALAGSLLLSLTVIPVVASVLLDFRDHHQPFLPAWLERQYKPLLEWSFAHQKTVFITAGVMLVAALGLYTQTGKTFMPTLDEGDVIVGVEKLPSVSLEDSVALDLRIQQQLMAKVPEIQRVVARVGSDEIGLDPMGLNQTDTFLELKPKNQWRMDSKDGLLDAIREVFKDLPGINYSFTQPIEMRVSEMVIGVRGDLAIKIYGPDIARLNQLAESVLAQVKAVEGNQDAYTLQNDGMQYLQVVIDRVAAGRLGLSVADIESALRIYVQGDVMGNVLEGQVRVPLVVRGDERLSRSPEDLQNTPIVTAHGESVPLKAVARLERVDGPVKIDREMGSRYSVVIANVTGRDLVGFVDEVKAKVASSVKLPEGYRVAYGGQFENQQRAAARLGLVTPIALALIFMLLYSSFGSVRQALLVFSNIPFALVGGIVALWLSGEYLSVPASVGFIALLGIAVLNGVVLVSYYNQLVEEGLPLHELVRVGALRRLRPVLMTASITALGLIPLLFATGPGSEIQRPLAVVVIGGLVTATALTLILLPLLYARFAFSSLTALEEK